MNIFFVYIYLLSKYIFILFIYLLSKYSSVLIDTNFVYFAIVTQRSITIKYWTYFLCMFIYCLNIYLFYLFIVKIQQCFDWYKLCILCYRNTKGITIEDGAYFLFMYFLLFKCIFILFIYLFIYCLQTVVL